MEMNDIWTASLNLIYLCMMKLPKICFLYNLNLLVNTKTVVKKSSVWISVFTKTGTIYVENGSSEKKGAQGSKKHFDRFVILRKFLIVITLSA